jgi:hypothetical protein
MAGDLPSQGKGLGVSKAIRTLGSDWVLVTLSLVTVAGHLLIVCLGVSAGP